MIAHTTKRQALIEPPGVGQPLHHSFAEASASAAEMASHGAEGATGVQNTVVNNRRVMA